MTEPEEKHKLPLWRLIAALFVLGSFVAVISALAPLYVDNYRFQQDMRAKLRGDKFHDDDSLKREIVSLARDRGLPVDPDEIEIGHPAGKNANKIQIDVRYPVIVVLPLYRVDLHFHASASGP